MKNKSHFRSVLCFHLQPLPALPQRIALGDDPSDCLEVVGRREDEPVAVVDVEHKEVTLAHHQDVPRVWEPSTTNSFNSKLSSIMNMMNQKIQS